MENKKIRGKDKIEDVVLKYPKTVSIFFKYGIPAMACGEPIWGTIEENAKKYKVKEIDKLLEDLNRAVEETFIWNK